MVAAQGIGIDDAVPDTIFEASGDDEIVDSPAHVPIPGAHAVGPPGIAVCGVRIEVPEGINEACVQQLRLADAIGARCCVNISGAFGPKWDFCYRENYTQEAYEKNVAFIRSLLDTVKPRRTCYALESMQWMLPSSPEETLKIIQDIGSPHFKAHVDICNMVNDPYKFTHTDELIDRCFALLGDQIVSCHLKDITMDEGSTVHITEVLPGQGQMDLRRYLQRIAELADKDTPVLIEHLPDKASYEKALKHVRSIGSEWL